MLEFHVLICTTTRRAEFCSAPSKMKKKMNAGIPSMVFNNVAPMVIHSRTFDYFVNLKNSSKTYNMPAASLALHAVVAPSITAVRYIAFLRRDFNLGSGRTLYFAEESFYNFYCCVALLVFGSSPPLPPSPFLKRWSVLYAVDTGSSPEALRLPGWNRCHVHFGVAVWPLPLKRMHKVLNYIIGLSIYSCITSHSRTCQASFLGGKGALVPIYPHKGHAMHCRVM